MRSVKDFGAIGDGVADDAEAIQHAVREGLGQVFFPPGDYRISSTIDLDTTPHGRLGVEGAGGTAKIIMAGPGPAFALSGSHEGTASPASVRPEVWAGERMPTLRHLEIEGAHDEADGIAIEGTMQSCIEGVLLRNLRHGIHLHRRARNVIISHCHIYDNRGIGIFCDDVNLHQINVANCHISYCRLSGIKVLNGEIRNLQITGNDIEYNYDPDLGEDAPQAADIWIDTSGERGTVREGTITGNTIQSRYSPGGANVYIQGRGEGDPNQAGMWTIAGNLLGSQEVNVRLEHCRAVTVTGNVIYSGHRRNLHAVDCRNVVVSGNSFDHNHGSLPRELATGITFERCGECSLTGSTIQDAEAGEHTVPSPVTIVRKGLVEVTGCRAFTLSGCQVLDSAEAGVYLEGGEMVSITSCTIADQRATKKMRAAIEWIGNGRANYLAGNILGQGREAAVRIAPNANVRIGDNHEA